MTEEAKGKRVKPKRPLDWKDLGKFNSTLLDLFGTARDTMTRMGIGLEIVDWLANGGQWEFAEFLEKLGGKYKSAHEPIKVTTPDVPIYIDLAKFAALVPGGIAPFGTSVEDIIKKCLTPKWKVANNGVIYLTLPPTKGWQEEWIGHFSQKGYDLNEYVKSVICSQDFQPSTGVVHRIAILPAKLWQDSDRITSRMRQDAETGVFTPSQRLTTPPPEVGCLIRDFLTDEEIRMLGFLYITAMHPPIPDSGGNPSLLAAYCVDCGHRLFAFYDSPGLQWRGAGGFAWSIVPQAPANDQAGHLA